MYYAFFWAEIFMKRIVVVGARRGFQRRVGDFVGEESDGGVVHVHCVVPLCCLCIILRIQVLKNIKPD